MKRIGNTPAFGIDADEDGLFVSSIEFTPGCEELEQLDRVGEVQGICLYRQRIEVSMSGEVPYQATKVFAMGADLEMANQPDDGLWLEKPAATTTVIKPTPYSRSRESAQEASVSAVIYPFGTAASA